MSLGLKATAFVLALPLIMAVHGVGAQTNSTATVDCKTPSTQASMNLCAYEDFLATNSGYAEANQAISSKLSGKQRDLFRRSQKAWIAHRTAACDFESSGLLGGSAQGMVKWQCAARMTRARVVELTALSKCSEGDLSCIRLEK